MKKRKEHPPGYPGSDRVSQPPAIRASDLRAARARLQIPIYKLGAMISMHPGRLALMLNERIALPEPVAKRVAEALQQMGGAPKQ